VNDLFSFYSLQTKGPKEDISEGVGLDESGSIKPGTVSEDDVILIAHELGHLWKKGGQVLKVPKAVIDQIEANKSEVSDKCYGKCNYVVIMGYIMIHTFSYPTTFI